MSVHPAALPVEQLLAECRVRRTRRSGPGGQHRNKVETAVVLTHEPTGIVAEASERRSQSENHARALFRLRVRLALEVRRPAPEEPSALWRSRCGGGRISLSETHHDFPAMLAEALDVLSACRFEVPPAAARLGCSASQLLKLLRLAPAALMLVNEQRAFAGRRSFK